MKRLALVALSAAIVAAAAAAQTSGPDRLEGLWAARQHYGPDVRGTLLILPQNGALTADIAGFSVPVQQQGQT